MTTELPLYFDTDCLSAFLWVKDESLLSQLYPGRVIVPKQVYDELGSVPHLQARIDILLKKGDISLMEIRSGTEEHQLYTEFTRKPKSGRTIIGHGEAASLALAKGENGIVASNNLKDISQYITEYHLKHKTTGDILIEALDCGLITENEGNTLWSNMLKKRRKLGACSFSDYLKQKGR